MVLVGDRGASAASRWRRIPKVESAGATLNLPCFG